MSLLPALLSTTPPILLGSAAALSRRGPRDAAWRRAELAAAGTAVFAVAQLAAFLVAGSAHGLGLRLDGPGAVLGLVVAGLGWVLVRFSRRYLAGDASGRQYLRNFCLTLAAVSVVLVADHLLLLAAAWTTTSLMLHRLLRHFSERPAARLAAHKKFLAARIADVAFLVGAALLAWAYGTLGQTELLERSSEVGVPFAAQVGLAFVSITVLLKCAQLPLHGWLIQVMEAPTPVSALLHAGVVNLGGLVLLRLAPLFAEAPGAQIVLATLSTLSVVLATLVMGTRISIKVHLAWSTVAQMGFMLLQLSLGLTAMALVHLVAHSLYKAYAFASAGTTVQRQLALQIAPMTAPPSAAKWALSAAAGLCLLLGGGAALGAWHGSAEWLAAAAFGVAIAPLAAVHPLRAFGVVLAWIVSHAIATGIVARELPVSPFLVAAVGIALALLFTLQAAIALRPDLALVRRLHPWAFGGFFVDERVSARLLRRWPVPNSL